MGKDTPTTWHTLSDAHTALTQVLFVPAGGLILRRLTTTEQPGWMKSLTIDEVQALRALLVPDAEPALVMPQPSPLGLPLDEMATILKASGWLILSPAEAHIPAMPPALPDLHLTPLPHVNGVAQVTVAPLTLLAHCAAVLAQQRGIPVLPEAATTQMGKDLIEMGFQCDWRYADHAAELARKDARFPVEE